jgi:hypothetical protein
MRSALGSPPDPGVRAPRFARPPFLRRRDDRSDCGTAHASASRCRAASSTRGGARRLRLHALSLERFAAGPSHRTRAPEAKLADNGLFAAEVSGRCRSCQGGKASSTRNDAAAKRNVLTAITTRSGRRRCSSRSTGRARGRRVWLWRSALAVPRGGVGGLVVAAPGRQLRRRTRRSATSPPTCARPRLRALFLSATLERGHAIVRAGDATIRSGEGWSRASGSTFELAEGGSGASVEKTRPSGSSMRSCITSRAATRRSRRSGCGSGRRALSLLQAPRRSRIFYQPSDPRDQLAGVDRLDHVVIGPDEKSGGAIEGIGSLAGDEDDRNVVAVSIA